jgi:hypothetical protein
MKITKLASIACTISGITLAAYAVLVLVGHDPHAASTGDLIGSTVICSVAAIGLALSARQLWHGKKPLFPLVIVPYFVISAVVGAIVLLAAHWSYRSPIYIMAVQAIGMVLLLITFLLVLMARSGRQT